MPVPEDDAPAAPVPKDDAPAALIPADSVLPSQFPPNNGDTFAQTFGRPIGDQSWRYGEGRGCVSDYGGTASPTPIADNWGDIGNWRTLTSPQAPRLRGRDWK